MADKNFTWFFELIENVSTTELFFWAAILFVTFISFYKLVVPANKNIQEKKTSSVD